MHTVHHTYMYDIYHIEQLTVYGQRCGSTIVADQIARFANVKTVIGLFDIVDDQTVIRWIDLHAIAGQLAVLFAPLQQRTRIAIDHALKANAIANLRRHVFGALSKVRFHCEKRG